MADTLESALREAVRGYSQDQRQRAFAAIAANRVKPLRRPGHYQVTSSNGVAIYICRIDMCPCPAPGRCYHRCSVAMLEARKAIGA